MVALNLPHRYRPADSVHKCRDAVYEIASTTSQIACPDITDLGFPSDKRRLFASDALTRSRSFGNFAGKASAVEGAEDGTLGARPG